MHIAAMVAGLAGLYEAGRLLYEDKEKENSNFLPYLLMGLGLVGSGAGHLFQMVVSRNNEFKADDVASRLYGPELISALQKIHNSSGGRQRGSALSATYAHMYFNNPVSKMVSWLSTHPPLEARVNAIKKAAAPSKPTARIC